MPNPEDLWRKRGEYDASIGRAPPTMRDLDTYAKAYELAKRNTDALEEALARRIMKGETI